VNILDENIPKNQRQLLESWRIHVRQIGFNIGQRGMQDEEIMKCASAGTTNQRSAGCGTWAQLFSSQIQNQTEIRSRRSLKISMRELV
jgi:hypothetical protein